MQFTVSLCRQVDVVFGVITVACFDVSGKVRKPVLLCVSVCVFLFFFSSECCGWKWLWYGTNIPSEDIKDILPLGLTSNGN